MKAIRVNQFGGPEVLRLEEIADPVAGPGQVVVAMESAGVNPVETYVRAGTYAMKPKLPYTPGADGAGIVESVAADVFRHKPGDRVYVAGTISGSYAEKSLCLESQVHPLPAQVTFAQGAAIWVPYGTSYHALLHRARAMPGENVLIHGASGGVGVAAVQWARAAGMTVFGSAGTEKGRKLVAEVGAHHVLDHTGPGYLEEAVKLTQSGGFNVILEMLANVNLGRDLEALAKFGRVVVIGSRGPVQIDPRLTMGKESSILGISLNNASLAEQSQIHAAIGAGLENKALQPVIGREIPLADAAQAHVAVMEPGAYGKIVLRM